MRCPATATACSRTPSTTAARRVAWELSEDERPGQFDVDEARRLGVPEGPAFGELQRGAP